MLEIVEPEVTQCSPLKRITLSQHKTDNNNRIILFTDILYVLLRYKAGMSNSNCSAGRIIRFMKGKVVRGPQI